MMAGDTLRAVAVSRWCPGHAGIFWRELMKREVPRVRPVPPALVILVLAFGLMCCSAPRAAAQSAGENAQPLDTPGNKTDTPAATPAADNVTKDTPGTKIKPKQ